MLFARDESASEFPVVPPSRESTFVQDSQDGPFGTFRRSIRQINPFKNRLFRLPATPRLTRAKKVFVGRGEELTGWNFERPSVERSQLSNPAQPRPPLLPPHNPSNIPSTASQFSQKRNSAQISAADRQRLRLSAIPGHSNDAKSEGITSGELDNDDFESFVASIGNISSGFTGGGSCRVGHHKVMADNWRNEPSPSWAKGNASVAIGRVHGNSRQRLPLPSFEPLQKPEEISRMVRQMPIDAAQQSQLFLQQRRRTWYPPPTQQPITGKASLHPVSSGPNLFALGYDKSPDQCQREQLLLLPSTSYAPNGEMCSANWHPQQQLQQQRRRPIRPLTMSNASAINASNRVPPDSPTLSTISLLSTAPPNGFATRSASTNSTAAAIRTHRWQQSNAGIDDLVYRRSVRLSRQKDDNGSPILGSNHSAAGTLSAQPIELLSLPVPLFTLADEFPATEGEENDSKLCTCTNFNVETSKADLFFGREWLFDELYRLVAFDRKPFVLLQGAGGTGKSAVLRQLTRHSPSVNPQRANSKNNNDTVDSGIAIDGTGPRNPSDGYSSQFSTDPRSENASLNPLTSSCESLKKLASQVVAFHFCHLYNPASCSIAEFVRNLAAQMCAAPLLDDYARVIRSDMRLHELIVGDLASLEMNPVELFHTLILDPLAKVGPSLTKARHRIITVKSTKTANSTDSDWPTTTGISLKSDYESGDELSANLLDDNGYIVILVDALDEAGFHRNDGGESIGWLLRRCIPDFPPFLRFICSASTSASTQAVFGTVPNAIGISSIRLDDPQLNLGKRDAKLLAEHLFHHSKDSVVHALPDFDSPSESAPDLAVCSVISRNNPLFIRLLYQLTSDEQFPKLKPTEIPEDLDQLYRFYLNYRFPALSFRLVAPILSILLASLRPLTFEELLGILNAPTGFGGFEESIDESELWRRLMLLSPIVIKMASGIFVPVNQTFREWLLKESAEVDPVVDIRHGHILLSLWLVRRNTPFSHERLFELAHHLLKANPHKYIRQGMAPEMPCGKSAQVQWIQRAANYAGTEAERLLRNGLLYRRNVFYPNSKVSRLLLLAGADPNNVWPDTGESILGSYARSGNIEMVELLLQFGANPNSASSCSPNPLILAIQNGHEDIVRVLCDHGTSIVDANGTHALVHAAIAESESIINFLLNYERSSAGDLLHCQNGIQKAFEAAAQRGNARLCLLLSERTSCPIEMTQALSCAVESGSSDLVIYLLNNGALDGLNSLSGIEQISPLMVAARHGHNALIDLLVSKGAAIDTMDHRGCTALMHAIEKGKWQSAGFLIDLGSNIRLHDSHSNSLLHLLAMNPNKCLINRLLETGLSLEEKNSEGLRPIEVAIQHGKGLAVDTFLRRGARLRSLTWQVAMVFNPSTVPVLVQKLLDDAALLLRRRQTNEALHRLDYALQKCNEILLSETLGEGREESPERIAIKPQLRQLKGQSLLSIAYLKRRNNELAEALMLATEALHLAADEVEQKFDALFFRAKCFFDVREMEKARIDAKMAATLRPDDVNANNLLSILSTPGR